MISKREVGIMALNIPIEPLKKTALGLDLVLRCEPSTYEPIGQCISHCAIRAGYCYLFRSFENILTMKLMKTMILIMMPVFVY